MRQAAGWERQASCADACSAWHAWLRALSCTVLFARSTGTSALDSFAEKTSQLAIGRRWCRVSDRQPRSVDGIFLGPEAEDVE